MGILDGISTLGDAIDNFLYAVAALIYAISHCRRTGLLRKKTE